MPDARCKLRAHSWSGFEFMDGLSTVQHGTARKFVERAFRDLKSYGIGWTH